ncbi:MAG: NAD-dependent epimerase/dehydratase family protein [Acidobacteria bacterium]|nr:NAD-dependent epimerase/dehydratase family protein [Acidobacteriota bacterium]
MRRLIVGCGYLGARVARAWRDAGDQVYATTRGAQVEALSGAGFQPLILDVTAAPVLRVLPDVDTVLFAVARARNSDATMFDIHVAGLRAVLDALPAPASRVIYVSTTGVYGQDRGEWVDEASVTEPLREGGQACLAAEGVLFGHERGRDGVVLRMAGLYGTGRIPRADDVLQGQTIAGSPDAYLNLIHVDDAARAVVAAGDPAHGGGKTYVVSDSCPPTRGEYVAEVASRLGRTVPPFSGGSGRGKRVRSTRIVRTLDLQLKYRSFREGLAASCPDTASRVRDPL